MYLARDKNGELFLYTKKPCKSDFEWSYDIKDISLISSITPVKNHMFPEVRWEDKEPTEIEIVSINAEQKRHILWAARDKNKELYLYEDKPFKSSSLWNSNSSMKINDSLLPEVTWDDEEPTKIEIVINK